MKAPRISPCRMPGYCLLMLLALCIFVEGQEITTVLTTDTEITTAIDTTLTGDTTDTTRDIEETTPAYPQAGERCGIDNTLPQYWFDSESRCCKCTYGRTRCHTVSCPEPPTDTSNCLAITKCGCTWWKCRFPWTHWTTSREDGHRRPSIGRHPGGRRRPFGNGRRGGFGGGPQGRFGGGRRGGFGGGEFETGGRGGSGFPGGRFGNGGRRRFGKRST